MEPSPSTTTTTRRSSWTALIQTTRTLSRPMVAVAVWSPMTVARPGLLLISRSTSIPMFKEGRRMPDTCNYPTVGIKECLHSSFKCNPGEPLSENCVSGTHGRGWLYIRKSMYISMFRVHIVRTIYRRYAARRGECNTCLCYPDARLFAHLQAHLSLTSTSGGMFGLHTTLVSSMAKLPENVIVWCTCDWASAFGSGKARYILQCVGTCHIENSIPCAVNCTFGHQPAQGR